MEVRKFLQARWGILAGIVGILAVLAVYLAIAASGSPGMRAREALELGERYLLDGEYEQAIVQFTAAIEITDREPELANLGDEAREGRDTAARSGAVSLLQTPGNDLEDAVDWLAENGCLDLPSAYYFTDALSLLQQLEELCAEEAYDAVFTLLADPAYTEIVSGIMGLDCRMALLNAETGQMTAVYRMEVETENFADGDGADAAAEETEAEDGSAAAEDAGEPESYMVYYGAHAGGVREGEGVWLAYQDGNNYLADGSWTGDRPNGHFETRSWQADLNATVTYRVISGEVVDGLWDGRVIWRFERGDTADEYTPSFAAGVWQILREEDGFAIAAENEDGARLIAAEPDKKNGIAGYAEAA